jgi:hypothetical protein
VDDVVVARLVLGLLAQDAAVKAHSWAGSSSLPRPSNGPALTCRTVTPGLISTTGGRSLEVARVKTSTAMPRSASRRDTSTT